ncbi:MAG: hypothetical protein U0936_20660 [Planctomycetaceae bacterium]
MTVTMADDLTPDELPFAARDLAMSKLAFAAAEEVERRRAVFLMPNGA